MVMAMIEIRETPDVYVQSVRGWVLGLRYGPTSIKHETVQVKKELPYYMT